MLVFSNFRVLVQPDFWIMQVVERDHLRCRGEVSEFVVEDLKTFQYVNKKLKPFFDSYFVALK